MDETRQWYLLKFEDGTIFGPVQFAQLRQWAREAQVSPLDKVSTDGSNWIKAPMVPELEMDYLVEVAPDEFYGPTTLMAVREFFAVGEITGETLLTNCRDGSARRVGEVEELALDTEDGPGRTSIRISLQQRIRDLEEALLLERRGREAAEARCDELEARMSALNAALNG